MLNNENQQCNFPILCKSRLKTEQHHLMLHGLVWDVSSGKVRKRSATRSKGAVSSAVGVAKGGLLGLIGCARDGTSSFV